MEENNKYRFNTERKHKRVTFNKQIHIINIHNYKNEIKYYIMITVIMKKKMKKN